MFGVSYVANIHKNEKNEFKFFWHSPWILHFSIENRRLLCIRKCSKLSKHSRPTTQIEALDELSINRIGTSCLKSTVWPQMCYIKNVTGLKQLQDSDCVNPNNCVAESESFIGFSPTRQDFAGLPDLGLPGPKFSFFIFNPISTIIRVHQKGLP